MSKAAELTIERLSLGELLPHPKNPRKHPEPGTSEWESLRKSLEHDYFDPLIWNRRNGMLVSGHLRKKVLAASGFTHADCVVVDYDEDVHVARMLAANRLTGEDDMEAMAKLLDEFHADKTFEFALTGWNLEGFNKLTSNGNGNGVITPTPASPAAVDASPVDFDSQFKIVITCPDEAAQTSLLEEFVERGLECRVFIA